MRHRGGSRLLPAAAAAALALAAGGARAQAPLHPLPSGPTALHQRVERADAIAVGVVDEVAPDRIHVRDADAIVGSVPARFRVKRAPSDPPELAPGDRALLLLQGVRSPYVLVEGARGAMRLAPDDERGWTEAVAAFAAARDDPGRRLAVYLAHLEDASASLRAESQRALLDPRIGLAPLPPEAALERAHAAFDPELDETTRLASAELASRDAGAVGELASGVLRLGTDVDARFVDVALRGAARTQHAALAPLVELSLEHPTAWLRRRALRLAPVVWSPSVEQRVRALADADPSERVREDARRLTRRVDAPH